jgi:nucleotide-binding universal stress UspA family protein
MLITTDGSYRGTNVARFSSLIARPAMAQVTLMGIAASSASRSHFEEYLEALREHLFEGSGCDVTLKIETGPAEEGILNEVDQHFYHLVCIGWYRRYGLRRLLYGSITRYLGQHVPVPLLVVSSQAEGLERMLICTSGERAGETDAYVGGTVAALVGADVTMLHVMSQIALTPDAQLEDLEEDYTALQERGAREGTHLKRTLNILAEQGVPAEQRRAKVRHGLVLDEIIQEVRQGSYDLVVFGAHQVPENRSQRGLRALLQENIADQILTSVKRPVLIVRALNDRQWSIKPEAQNEATPGD